jgi:hypothetical protein
VIISYFINSRADNLVSARKLISLQNYLLKNVSTMKRIWTIMLLLLVVGVAALAQDASYQPLVREGVRWVNHKQYVYSGETYYFGPKCAYTYELKGDTVITIPSGAHAYKIVAEADPEVFLRESDKRVYVLDRGNLDCADDEYLLYDFSQEAQATLCDPFNAMTKTFDLVDVVEIAGKSCRVFMDHDWGFLVESIGLVSPCDGDLIHPRWARVAGGEYNYGIDHVEDLDGNIIYKAPWYEEPAHCKPLVREGVVWHYAYEDFIFDGIGVIDSTYRIIDHKMEFSGDTCIYGIQYKKCYFYYTDQLPPDAQPVVLAREHNGKVIFAPVTFNEGDYWESDDIYHPEGSLPGPYIDIRGEYVAYDFGDMAGFLQKIGWLSLVSTSLTLVGEDSVQCYQTSNSGQYVESVGYDGSYAGYLDDPFPPRPTCICPGVLGLIMLTNQDGRILYRGKYFQYYQYYKCDINRDGRVDISDVNEVINVMLGKSAAPGDVTGDGTVDISDVNAVINAMLGK